MKAKELRTKSMTELSKQREKTIDKLRNLRAEVFIKEVKNTRQIRSLKRELSRINTLINEKKVIEE